MLLMSQVCCYLSLMRRESRPLLLLATLASTSALGTPATACSAAAKRSNPCGKRKGLFLRRRWIADWKAYEFDHKLGWAVEHWFEWLD